MLNNQNESVVTLFYPVFMLPVIGYFTSPKVADNIYLYICMIICKQVEWTRERYLLSASQIGSSAYFKKYLL